MKRICVIGSGGAGKSTLACQIGTKLGIEVIHLDKLYWKPGWIETPKPEWESIQHEIIKRPSWIIDGNYGGTLDIRLAAADTIIFLDIPKHICLWRVIKRRIKFWGRSRPDMTDGCIERIAWDYVKWIWTYPRRRLPGILQKLNEYAEGRIIVRLRNTSDIRSFIKNLGSLTLFG
jgi:adenylate kinase family enzyme